MPNKKLEAYRVNQQGKSPMRDKRRKLTPEQREDIKAAWEAGTSQRALAREYGVSRRLISFICCPEKKARDLELRKQRGGWRAYYNKDLHAATTKKHRDYKKRLMDKEAKIQTNLK